VSKVLSEVKLACKNGVFKRVLELIFAGIACCVLHCTWQLMDFVGFSLFGLACDLGVGNEVGCLIF